MAVSAPRKKLVIAFASLVLFLGLAEVGLRLANFAYTPYEAPIVIWDGINDAELASQEGLHIAAPRQFWVPRPEAEIPLTGPEDAPREFINEAGYRGPMRPVQKPPGVLRVITLGDSSTFGINLPYEEVYSARLERLLCERGLQAEVLDFGVIGFTLLQGIERYRALARDYQPDFVVAAHGCINEHIPAKQASDRDKLARDITRDTASWKLWRAARENIRALQVCGWIGDELRGGRRKLRMQAAADWQQRLELEGTAEELGWTGVRRMSPEEFALALDELRVLTSADGAVLILMSMARKPGYERECPVLLEYSGRILRMAEDQVMALVDARALFEREHAQADHADLLMDTVHPSPKGHALLAAALAKAIEGPPGAPAGR